jgi:hypothetical protein
MTRLTSSQALGGFVAAFGMLGQPALAQTQSGEDLIRTLQSGGYVLVMNQAPAAMPEPGSAGRDGRGGGFGGGGGGRGGRGAPPGDPVPMLTSEAEAMLVGTRHAIWYFRIPIDAVYTSPVPAAAQHAGEVPFTEVAQVAGLADSSADSGWLEARLSEPAMGGNNAIIVTHAPNIESALGIDDIAAGETVVVRPGDDYEVVGRLGLRQWSVLAIELEP